MIKKRFRILFILFRLQLSIVFTWLAKPSTDPLCRRGWRKKPPALPLAPPGRSQGSPGSSAGRGPRCPLARNQHGKEMPPDEDWGSGAERRCRSAPSTHISVKQFITITLSRWNKFNFDIWLQSSRINKSVYTNRNTVCLSQKPLMSPSMPPNSPAFTVRDISMDYKDKGWFQAYYVN